MPHFRSRAMGEAGFTLAELLIVLALLSLVLLVSAPSFSRILQSNFDKAALQDLTFNLDQAQRRAVRTGEEVVFRLDVSNGSYGIEGTSVNGQLPAEWSLDVVTAAQEQTSADEVGIRYWPSGSSTGARISIADGGYQVDLEVDWLTGLATQVDSDKE